jgi:hypothetical protein
MRPRNLLPALSLVLVLGCNAGVRYDDNMLAPTTPTSSATAPETATPTAVPTPTETAPAPTASAGAKEPLKLKVEGRWVDVKAKETVVYTPDSGVQKPSYTHYRFKYADYTGAVGEANLKKDAELEVDCVPGTEKGGSPPDPNAPAPVGGIQNKYLDCKILKGPATK